MLKTRLLTALVAVPILIALIVVDPPTVFLGLVLVVNAIGLHELAGLFERGRARAPLGFEVSLVAVGSALVWSFHGGDPTRVTGAFAIGGLVLLARSVVGRGADVRERSDDLTTGLTGLFYVSFLLGHLVLLRELEHGQRWVIFVIGVVFMADTGAYFAGRSFGRTPLSALSPKKTREGSVGGLLAAGAFGALYAAVLLDRAAWHHGVLLAVPVAAMSQIGDLAESMLKRAAGKKDSGVVVPGHGGILDRLDSILPSCPLVYYGAVLLGIV